MRASGLTCTVKDLHGLFLLLLLSFTCTYQQPWGCSNSWESDSPSSAPTMWTGDWKTAEQYFLTLFIAGFSQRAMFFRPYSDSGVDDMSTRCCTWYKPEMKILLSLPAFSLSGACVSIVMPNLSFFRKILGEEDGCFLQKSRRLPSEEIHREPLLKRTYMAQSCAKKHLSVNSFSFWQL